MPRRFCLVASLLLCLSLYAGPYDLLWDYTHGAPSVNPDRGLCYFEKVADGPGKKNGFYGLKLNDAGYAYFHKSAVPGYLMLSFGPRSGINPTGIDVYTWPSALDTLPPMEAMTKIATTPPIRSFGTVQIALTADQNAIYLHRSGTVETALQCIRFVPADTVFSPQVLLIDTVAIALPSRAHIPAPLLADSIARALVKCDPATNSYTVPASNTAAFLWALHQANSQGHATIYLPNGKYDLGETVLTAIQADHIAIIGQSMDSTIIVNAPDYRLESIDRTATLMIAEGVKGTYLRDLTIQNALDYYHDDNGRAVCLWDRGTETVCKNVKLLSHQDTYYSDCIGAVRYFETCEIHGTVDFICGNGSVYFDRCLLYAERRQIDGHGVDALTANSSAANERGFVFANCTIVSACPVVSLGRAWNRTPKVVFLNTLIDYRIGRFDFADDKGKVQRWTRALMNANAWPNFGEYNMHLVDGTLLTPKNNTVLFMDAKSGNATRALETVLTSAQASRYTITYTLGDWANTALQCAQQGKTMK